MFCHILALNRFQLYRYYYMRNTAATAYVRMPRQGIEIKASPVKQWLGVLLIQSMLLRASHTRDSAFKGS